MKTPITSESRHHRLREAYRHELGAPGLFVEGTLCKVRRPGRKPPEWQLTFKQAGKTRTVYVPAELVPEVQLWAKEFKRLKQLIRKVSTQNYHLMMQVAFILWQLLAKGVLRRLTQACRKVTDVKLVELLRTSLLYVPVTDDAQPFGQLRFSSA